jgi:benzaldehyde dehydrogenase (NAD)
MAASRHLVHRKVVDQYVNGLTAAARQLRVGDPFREDVSLGPLIDHTQRDRVDRIVQDTLTRGSRLMVGAQSRDLFYDPTVLSDVTPSMAAFDEEIFGPVAPITVVDNDDEAIALANLTRYGLTAGVHSRDITRALRIGRALNTGIVHINDQTINDEPYAPFGGRGRSGNGARYGSPTSLDEFTQWRWLTIRTQPPNYQL